MRLIYLSPVSWHSFSQRPHELVRCFQALTGKPVLWVEPYATRFPVIGDLALLRRRAGFTSEVPAWLTVIRPWALPLEPLPFSGRINRLLWQRVIVAARRFAVEPTLLGIGKPSALACQLLQEPIFRTSFYDGMDYVPAFYRGWSRYAMERRQRQTVRDVGSVLASSSALQSRFSALNGNTSLVLNACASERMPLGEPSRAPRAGRALVFGYVGIIAKWFDWAFIRALAEAYPAAEMRLIGPLHTEVPAALPANVRLLPALPHGEALRAMAQFDVGLIPFKKSEVTHFVDPIKYYEYRACGLPVVSTDFGEMTARAAVPGIFLADGPAQVAAACAAALAFRESDAARARFRRDNSWSTRFEVAYAALV
jgi:glycosyltransferase involved in cell wall biosynthesis